MIALLTGKLKRKAADYLIIDVAGVGYQVALPLSTLSSLPEAGEEITLHIHTHLREDSLSLFGFITEAEKEMFLYLMGVSGIGPKLALSVLSGFSVRDIAHAIKTSDDSSLCAIPGIGKKTAARIILELKDKIKSCETSPVSQPYDRVRTGDMEDAVSALINLGYKRPIAEEALRQASNAHQQLSLGELIREGLNILKKR